MAKLALELIAFQHDRFGQKLEIVLEGMQNHLKEHPDLTDVQLGKETQYFQQLEQLIFNRFGIKLGFVAPSNPNSFLMAYGHPALVSVVDYIKVKQNHKPELTEEQITTLESIYGKTGTVNLQTAKLGGVFSEIEHFLVLNFSAVLLGKSRITGIPQLTAVILHEVGHVFSYYEHLDRAVTTNQILAEVGRTAKNNKDLKTRNLLIGKLCEINQIPSSIRAQLEQTSDRDVLACQLYQSLMFTPTSQMGVGEYDATAPEALADSFATRLGYGRELIEALERLPLSQREWFDIVNSYNPLLNAIARIPLFGTLFYKVTSRLNDAFVGAVSFLVTSVLSVSSGAANKDYNVDVAKTRYRRIREQYVAMLQEVSLPRELLARIIDDIHAIDFMIRHAESGGSIMETFKNLLIPKHRAVANAIEIQQQLERLAHNDLFVKAAELRQFT